MRRMRRMQNGDPGLVRRAATLSLAVFLVALGRPSAAQQPDASQTDRMIADLGLHEAATPLNASPQWRKPARVVVRNLTPERKAWLQDVAPGVELVNADTTAEARAASSGEAARASAEEAHRLACVAATGNVASPKAYRSRHIGWNKRTPAVIHHEHASC